MCTGKERDDTTGFYYHGARYFAPWIGRWMSADPAGPVDGPNLYVYVSNNPVRKVDPGGTQEFYNYHDEESQMCVDPRGADEEFAPADTPNDEEEDWAGADAPPSGGYGGQPGDYGIEDYDPGAEGAPSSSEEEFGGDAPNPQEDLQEPGTTLADRVQEGWEQAKSAWKQGSTEDKVEIGATATGAVGGLIPYAGDYISLLGSIVSFGAKPSWSNAGDVGLDLVGAALPFVPALGTIRKSEKIAEAGKAAHNLEKAVDSVDAAKDIEKEVKLLEAGKQAKHHLFPQQFEKFFKQRGIDIHEFTVKIGQSTHLKGIHGKGLGDMPGKWNARWSGWMKQNPNATAKDVYQQLGKMMDEFGLSGLPIQPYK